ncbi:hypothetical protein ACFWVE_13230, partial [Streptomyces sp. NPDC058632]
PPVRGETRPWCVALVDWSSRTGRALAHAGPRVLLAAVYRTSYRKVNDAGGVPPHHRTYADRVAHYLEEYTPPARK